MTCLGKATFKCCGQLGLRIVTPFKLVLTCPRVLHRPGWFTNLLRSKAVRFQSFTDAKAFAKEHGITLNGLTYLGLEDFTDGELKSCGWELMSAIFAASLWRKSR
jgi:hypothetical protein